MATQGAKSKSSSGGRSRGGSKKSGSSSRSKSTSSSRSKSSRSSSSNGRSSASRSKSRSNSKPEYPDYAVVDPKKIPDGPDLLLDIPVVKVDLIDLEIDDLRAQV